MKRLQGLVRIISLILVRPLLASILWRLLFRRNKQQQQQQHSLRSPFISNLSYYLLLATTCVPALTRTLRRRLSLSLDGLFNTTHFFSFILGVRGGRLLPSGVYHGGVNSKGGRGARAARLQERVENYWITPFFNGDYATIFPTAMDLLKQMLFGESNSRSRSRRSRRRSRRSSSGGEHPRTIRKLFRNRQGELVATDWTFPLEEQQEEEEEEQQQQEEEEEGEELEEAEEEKEKDQSVNKTTKVCIFLAGVGGDSSSVYVRECT